MGGFVMRSQFARRITFTLVLLLTIGLCFGEASAQRKRTGRSRRVTNPVAAKPITPPPVQSTEPQIISTADQQASEQNNATDLSEQSSTTSTRRKNGTRVVETDNQDSTQRTINSLSSQVTKLSDKLSQMEQQQRTLVNLERLTRAEQRAETLRAQLSDAQSKEADLQARMEQIEYQIKPENIELTVATIGTTHPEQAREARRQALENEKTRISTQLNLLATNRQRLEASIVNADTEVDRLRKLVDETPQTQTNTDTTGNTDDTGTSTTTQPPIIIEQPATKSSTPPR
jgi:chromosome segregation ATPase